MVRIGGALTVNAVDNGSLAQGLLVLGLQKELLEDCSLSGKTGCETR
jgi:hypothetical protein